MTFATPIEAARYLRSLNCTGDARTALDMVCAQINNHLTTISCHVDASEFSDGEFALVGNASDGVSALVAVLQGKS